VITVLPCLLLLADPLPVSPIYGGEPADIEYDSTVALRAHTLNCTAVMLSPRVGLTAAHCLAEMRFGRSISATYGSSSLEDDGAERHQVERWGMHPGYCPDCRKDQLDLGFIELTLPMESLENPALPIVTQEDWDLLMQEGQELRAVGYGVDDVEGEIRFRNRAIVTIDEVAKNGREFNTLPRQGSPCEGDSGGPTFGKLENGELRLVGIYSRAVGGCPHDWGVESTPYSALCWLRDETDLDLLTPGDDDCQLLDTSREGCGCTTKPAPVGWASLLLFVLILWRRRGFTADLC